MLDLLLCICHSRYQHCCSLEMIFFMTIRVMYSHVWTIKYTLHSHEELYFGQLCDNTHNAILKCAFLAAWYSLAICASSSLTLRTSPDWWGGGEVCLFVYREWNIHIVRFSEQKLSRFSQCKWYLGLDFHSRLLLLRGKSQLLWAVIFLGGNLFLFHAARVLDQALNALKQKCFGPQPFTPSALLYVIE